MCGYNYDLEKVCDTNKLSSRQHEIWVFENMHLENFKFDPALSIYKVIIYVFKFHRVQVR